MNNTDSEYFRLINLVLEKGRIKANRTGINTLGVFGAQARFNLEDGFPLLTTKKVFFKGIVHELLWFIKGDTNIKYLVDNDVHIWDQWAYKRYKEQNSSNSGPAVSCCEDSSFNQKEFITTIKNNKEFARQWGELGMGTYGGMWRDFPFYDTDGEVKESKGVHGESAEQWFFGGVDQLQKVVEKLKSNPDDRRLIVSAWHPYWVDNCALPPCHVLFQFHTEELTWKERVSIGEDLHLKTNLLRCSDDELDGYNIPRRRLNCQLYQRSLDLPIGGPFNLASYSLLTSMISHCVGMTPGTFVWTSGDMHIYENQLAGVKEQLTREPRPLPKLWLNPEIKSLCDFKYEDIKLIGYDPHPIIKMPVAV